MTDPRDIWVAGFFTGAAFIGALAGWFGPTERTNNGLWNKQQRRARARDNNHDWRRSFNHENTNRPSGPPPLKLRRSRDPDAILPTTPKPNIVPKPQPPPGRIIDASGQTIGYRPLPWDGPTNPPPRNPLSPAAQAVLDASIKHSGPAFEPVVRRLLAAALRAAADQVVPEESLHGGDQRWMFERDARQERRKKLLAIAAELEGAKAEPPRRHVFPTPHQIAECGGPCEQGGPEACDCGLYERSASKSTHLEVGDEQ